MERLLGRCSGAAGSAVAQVQSTAARRLMQQLQAAYAHIWQLQLREGIAELMVGPRTGYKMLYNLSEPGITGMRGTHTVMGAFQEQSAALCFQHKRAGGLRPVQSCLIASAAKKAQGAAEWMRNREAGMNVGVCL